VLSLLVPAGETATAHAKNRRGSSSKSTASSKKSVRRSHVTRTYTVRGNPELARRVSMDLLAEKLPDLAALVGIEASSVASAPVALDAMTGTGTTSADAYHDSELDEAEDPDRLTAQDEQELEELPDEINAFYKEFTTYMAALNHESNVTPNGIDKQTVMESVMSWLGTRYLFGGMTRTGIDCSAFTGMIYRSLEYKLPRTAAAQWSVGQPVDRDELQFGDLVFFNTRKAVYVSHVGMYLGNGMFVHASSRNGVTVSSLNADYYSSHMIGARRYTMSSVASMEEAEPFDRN
jgi:cell wall-associated NlpC family hydrolase